MDILGREKQKMAADQNKRQKLWVYHSQEREFEKKCDAKWLFFVVVSFFIVIIGMTFLKTQIKDILKFVLFLFGENADYVFTTMRNEIAFLGNAVWTLTTIMAAFIVLHYSSRENSIYGIQYRKIIGYTFGSYFIPGLIIFNIIIVINMTCAYYIKSYANFYVLATYSIFLQILLIICSIMSTSQQRCFQIILKIERRQIQQLYTNSNTPLQERKNAIVYHVDTVLKGHETLTEKFEIIQEILNIPFYEKYQNTEVFNHCTYYYLYQNMHLMVAYICEHIEERQKMYSTFYNNANFFWGQYIINKKESTEKETAEKAPILLYMSALFHTIVPRKELKERWECILYIFTAIIDDESFRNILVIEFLMSLYDLWHRSEICLDKDETAELQNILKILLIDNGKYPAKGIYECIEEAKIELESIVMSWYCEVTFSQKRQYETMAEILDCIDNEDVDTYIQFLLKKVQAEGTENDKAVSV